MLPQKTGSTMDHDGESRTFLDGHPGHGFAYLAKNCFYKITIISMEKGKLCALKYLHLQCVDPDETIHKNRETYVKTALMFFLPFRTLANLRTNGSYWETFNKLRSVHYSHGRGEPDNYVSHDVTFWTT